MPPRSWRRYLPPIGTGLSSAWQRGYRLGDLKHDVLAGLTVGVVAIPLAMALAIATGVAPQHGLYTVIIGGLIIAVAGGSRFNISGPTAAFVVILLPIVQQFGLGGLLVATLMAGVILIAMGLARMGALLRYVPYPVVLGFTAGIAVVIAILQLPDLLGLQIPVDTNQGLHFVDKIGSIATSFHSLQPHELGAGLLTLALLIIWPKLKLPIPGPLAALTFAALGAWLWNNWQTDASLQLDTIASRFSWQIDGQTGAGIPAVAPSFQLPWQSAGADGLPLGLSFDLIRSLLGPAFAIAILAAIESLLCAVVADGMTRTRHDPNAELVGQGLGNMLVPFFGGITATAALARTATSIRSGARSPVAGVVHALVVLLAVVLLADILGQVPMAALAALLIIIAWNMSEAHLFVRTLRSANANDVSVLLVCFGLTVIFDMVIAVAVGIGLASALFIRRMALLTHTGQIPSHSQPEQQQLPETVALYDINGPMFFAAAEKALAAIHLVDPHVRVIIIDMQDVPSIDATAVLSLNRLVRDLQRQDIGLIMVGLTSELIVELRRAGIYRRKHQLSYARTFQQARLTALRWLAVR